MKILYHHRIASKDGQYVHVEELTNAFVELGHEINFVAPGFTDNTEFGNDGDIATQLKKLLPQSIYELLELSYSLLIAYKLIKQIFRDKPDFIYERYNSYQPMGVIVAKIFKIPLLLEVNAPLADERKKHSGLALYGLANFIEKYTWKNATKVLAVTQVLANIVSQKGVNKKNIEVIHNGINQNILNTVFKDKKTYENKGMVIGFVGFLNKWHRLDLAIKAISNFRDHNIQLICVGNGDIKTDLEAQAKKLGIEKKVIFTGLKSRSEVFNYVKDFDIALQPSVTPYASPLKLFEYMSSGCLIVAPRTSNICEVLNDKNSILFEPDNFDDFYEKLNFSIKNFSETGELQRMAKQTIYDGNFTWQQNAERVIDIANILVKKYEK